MSAHRPRQRARIGAPAVKDRMLANSALMFATTLMMAGRGALFWVVAARLQTPENVGLAGSLVVGGGPHRAVRPARAEHHAAAHDADERAARRPTWPPPR